jgi:hypothetical protein
LRDTLYISAYMYGYIYIYHEWQNIPDDAHYICKHFNMSTENEYGSVVYLKLSSDELCPLRITWHNTTKIEVSDSPVVILHTFIKYDC